MLVVYGERLLSKAVYGTSNWSDIFNFSFNWRTRIRTKNWSKIKLKFDYLNKNNSHNWFEYFNWKFLVLNYPSHQTISIEVLERILYIRRKGPWRLLGLIKPSFFSLKKVNISKLWSIPGYHLLFPWKSESKN